MKAEHYSRPRRRWSPPLGETSDPEDMYPPVVTGPPAPELPSRPGSPLEISGAEYDFETGAYTYTYECDEGEEFSLSHYRAGVGANLPCPTCLVHHQLAPIRGNTAAGA